jgi:hypothetical protein
MAKKKDTVDPADELFGLPLDEFTAARNDLAKRLRADGKRDEAEAVAALRKPSVAAWVVNRLARERRDGLRALVDAAEAVRAGREDADERFRGAADGLTRDAREILAEAGRPATDAVLREVATTLRAGAADAPDALVAGRLTETIEPSGFEAMAGATLAPRPPRPAAAPKRGRDDAKRLERARQALADARGEAARLGRAASEAEREAKRARREADQAARKVAGAEKRLAEVRAG